jgi:membrane-bound lytic murein transglycosylase MltF
VREGTSYHASLLRLNQDLTARKLEPVRIELLPGLVNTGEIIQMVGSGAVQLTVADSHLAEIAVELLDGVRINDHITFNEDVRLGWMVRKDNPELKASLDRFVKTVKKGTLKGNMFFKRYFRENPWAREYVQNEDLEALTRYAPLFQKYGEMYDIDWILIAAQSFQESRFDPNARSRTSTSQLGYDSNRWFNHTELGTMQRVGLELVHYVRNINKYYLSFRMSLALSELRKDIR